MFQLITERITIKFFKSCLTNYNVWFKFSATKTRLAVNLNNVSGVASFYQVFKGSDCEMLIPMSCQSAGISIQENLIIGQEYKIRVYSSGLITTVSPFKISVMEINSGIIVSNTQYAVPELITDVLLNSPCVPIANVQWSGLVQKAASYPFDFMLFDLEHGTLSIESVEDSLRVCRLCGLPCGAGC